MEKPLSIWIDNENERTMPLSHNITETATNHIKVETSKTPEICVARFNLNIEKIQVAREATSGYIKAAGEFTATLKTIIKRGNEFQI